MKSWRTTSLGILAIASAVLSAAQSVLDGNPTTNPDWPTLTTAIAAGWGLIVARDNKVTSEDAGAQ